MLLESWGRHPILEAQTARPRDTGGAHAALDAPGAWTPRGMGRSYGDSALGPRALLSGGLDLMTGFDPHTGVLEAQAGVSLDEILRVFVPRGWFLSVTPGTKYVSVGGSIAADVHGKNHHEAGCFSESVESLDLMLGDGEVLTCSRTANAEAFRATCGGMGLTGFILRARLRLRPLVSTSVVQDTLKARNLDELLDGFASVGSSPYSVAWIDCLKGGSGLGRGILTSGGFAPEGPLKVHRAPKLNVPLVPPLSPVTPLTMRAFNAFYYRHALRRKSRSLVHYDPFFYPLDWIGHWNRLYGRSGFTQYQLVIPREAGPKGLRSLLEAIASSGKGSFLAVLKVMGLANKNPLSFPMDGYTLALDFKIEPGLFPLLDGLDARVMDLGGRVYLAKDVRVGEAAFKRMYPRWTEFQETRTKLRANGRFASEQSRRLGLD